MSELQPYDVTVGAHQTVMLLSDDDAAAMGDAAKPAAGGPPAPPAPAVEVKSRQVLNKARTSDSTTAQGSPEGVQ